MRLWIAAAVAALLGAGAAVVGLAVSDGGADRGRVMPPASLPAGSVGPPLDGVQVSEPPAPELAVGAVSAGYGARTVGPAGVPVGFPHSPDGAAAAATAWLATVESAGVLDGQRRPVVLAAIGDPGFVAAASARVADRAASLGLDGSGRPQAGGYVMATAWAVRGAYRVLSYGPGAARVEVWHLYQLGVVMPGDRPAPGRWRRAVAALRWDARVGDWRLAADFGFVDGPDPQVATPSLVERAAVLARLGEGWRVYANAR